MKSLQFNTTISGKKKVITVVDVNADNKSKEKVKSSINHIFVLDRSVSMTGHINTLIDQVQYCMSQCRPNDLVSVIYFASADQCEVVLQLANPLADASKKVLDSLRSTIGLTCFSTPFYKVKDVILPTMVNLSKDYQTAITLFTDGEPCVPWTIEEEVNRVLSTCNQIADKVTSINCVGYGNYYNKAFLNQISASTEFGKIYHCSNIKEFGNLTFGLVEEVRELSSEPLQILSSGSEILLVTGELSNLKTGEVNVKNSSTDNLVFIISDTKPELYINGLNKFESLDKNNIEEYKEKFFRIYAFEKHYAGDRHTALDVVAKNLKDRYFAESQAQAFTNEEVQTYQSELRTSAFIPDHRYKLGKCPPNFVPKSDAACVVDLLQTLSEGDTLYLPFHEKVEKYSRIGRKAEDTHNLFKKSDELVASPMSELVLNSSGALNVSIRFSINGTVSLNPKSAKRVGLPPEIKSKILRNHTFIKDGNLNIKQAIFSIDLDKWPSILQKYSKAILIISEDINEAVFCVNFTKLPLINKTYLDTSANIETIYEEVFSEMRLQSERKLYSYILDDVYKSNILKRPETEYVGYSEDQIQVLQEHGIGKTGIYQGVNVVTPKTTESDFYNAKVIEFNLKGCSSIPKVSDALEGKKKDNPCIKAMNNSIDFMRETVKIIDETGKFIGNTEQASDILGTLEIKKEQINTLRFNLTKHRLAVALTGGWFQGLDESGKYDPKDGRPELTIKADYKKCYFTSETE